MSSSTARADASASALQSVGQRWPGQGPPDSPGRQMDARAQTVALPLVALPLISEAPPEVAAARQADSLSTRPTTASPHGLSAPVRNARRRWLALALGAAVVVMAFLWVLRSRGRAPSAGAAVSSIVATLPPSSADSASSSRSAPERADAPRMQTLAPTLPPEVPPTSSAALPPVGIPAASLEVKAKTTPPAQEPSRARSRIPNNRIDIERAPNF